MNLPLFTPLRAETLCGIDAFSLLDGAERQSVALRCRRRDYRAGQQILGLYERSRDVYFIVNGGVQVTMFSRSGRQITLQDLGAGEMFGELSALDDAPRAAHVSAASDTLLCSLSANAFNDVLRRYPSVTDATLKRLVSMVRMLSGRVFEISALPVKQRVRAELLRLALPHQDADGRARILPAPTHGAIASQIGTNREGVTREMNRLRASGLIESRRREIVVNRVAELRRLVGDAV